MLDGKKSTAQKIVYGAFNKVEENQVSQLSRYLKKL